MRRAIRTNVPRHLARCVDLSMAPPFANGGNGQRGRDSRGRFRSGNRAAAGRGNPHADRVNAWRTALAATVTEDDLRTVIAKLVELAKAGERWAVREMLDRCLGRPAQEVTSRAADLEGEVVLKLEFDNPRSTAPPTA